MIPLIQVIGKIEMSREWNRTSVQKLFESPLFEVVSQAYAAHKKHFDPSEMEYCSLLNIKTGGCPEDCSYCPQSVHYNTGLKKEKLFEKNIVLEQAKLAKKSGAKRFCMGAAWRSPPKKGFQKVLGLIGEIKSLGLETCVTLGLLNESQAKELKLAELDYYNHNLDTSEKFYSAIITTRTYQDRLETIKHVVDVGIKVCCGGILGLGESREDRIELLLQLKNLPEVPKSIPINKLIPLKGTPLENAREIDKFEFIKTIAITRIMFPQSMIRLSAGREQMSEEYQSWCFMSGANSIFIGDVLLTAPNQNLQNDLLLMEKIGMKLPCSSSG